MTIHKEGYPTIAISFAALALIDVLVFRFAASPAGWVVFILSLILFLFLVSFFRIPARALTMDDRLVIAPADGKVVVIEETEEPEYFKDRRLQISIFMSPANVHVNRNPIGGEVKLSRYHEGKYLVAWHPKSSTENERHTVVIGNGRSDILVRQIAGAMARRIVNYLSAGQQVKQNTEMGFIKFGSRVDVFLPPGTPVEVHLNQAVKGGVTVLAKLVS